MRTLQFLYRFNRWLETAVNRRIVRVGGPLFVVRRNVILRAPPIIIGEKESVHILDIGQLVGNVPSEPIAVEIQVFEGLRLHRHQQSHRNGPRQHVAGEIESAEIHQVFQSGGQCPGQRVCRQRNVLNDAEQLDLGRNPSGDVIGGEIEPFQCGQFANRRRKSAV